MRQHAGSELDQFINLQLGRLSQRRTLRRREFEGAHATNADVAQPFDGVEAVRPTTLGGEPGIDECVAESVRQ